MLKVKQIDGLQAILDTYSTEWLDSAISILLTPPAPVLNNRYLINWVGTATGVWVGKEGQIAEWDGAAWIFTDPTLGTSISVDTNPTSTYRVTVAGNITWVENSTGISAGIYAGSSTLQSGITTVSMISNNDAVIFSANGNANALHIRDVSGVSSLVGIGIDPIRYLDINLPQQSQGIGMYAHNGSTTGLATDSMQILFESNDINGTRRTGAIIKSRVKALTATTVEAALLLNSKVQIRNVNSNTTGVLIRYNNVETHNPSAMLDVINNSLSGFPITFSIIGSGSSSNLILNTKNENNDTLSRIYCDGRTTHNFSQLSTGDFNVGSINDANMLFVNAGTDRISIGSGISPSARLHIKGAGSTSATASLLIQNSSSINIMRMEDDGAWSLGYNTAPNNGQNVLIGYHATAFTPSGIQSILIGSSVDDNSSTGSHVAIGVGASVSGTAAAVAIGSGATVLNHGVAIGLNAAAEGGDVAMGSGATTVLSNGGVAIGLNAAGTGSQAIAIGRSASASGLGGATALGNSANASGNGSVSIGTSSAASSLQSIAIGFTALSSAPTSIAIGRQSENSGNNSISIGYEAEILSTINSAAIGVGTAVTAAGAQMIGWKSTPTTTKITNSVINSIGFGWDTTTPDVLFAKTANQFIAGSGDLGIFNKVSANKFSITPVQYVIGTASQTTTTVTGVGTTWTAAMVGSQFVFEDGTHAGTITAFGSTTSLTVSTSATVSSQSYQISYTGLQLSSIGRVGIGITPLNAAMHVRGSDELAGTNGFLVESLAGAANLTVQNDGVIVYRGFAKASLPIAVAGGVIRVTDEIGGDTIAYSDGINWRRVSDGAIVS